ncbi:MAG TPA: hypothetical protein VF128_04670 [Gemmatimonadaceae bacterium]
MKEANREVLDRGSLPDLLVQRARSASDKRLVADAAVGLVAAATVAVLRPPLWIPLASLAFCLGAFGIWGILDRETADLSGGKGATRFLLGARVLAAALGGVAAAIFGVSLFFALLGQWIS